MDIVLNPDLQVSSDDDDDDDDDDEVMKVSTKAINQEQKEEKQTECEQKEHELPDNPCCVIACRGCESIMPFSCGVKYAMFHSERHYVTTEERMLSCIQSQPGVGTYVDTYIAYAYECLSMEDISRPVTGFQWAVCAKCGSFAIALGVRPGFCDACKTRYCSLACKTHKCNATVHLREFLDSDVVECPVRLGINAFRETDFNFKEIVSYGGVNVSYAGDFKFDPMANGHNIANLVLRDGTTDSTSLLSYRIKMGQFDDASRSDKDLIVTRTALGKEHPKSQTGQQINKCTICPLRFTCTCDADWNAHSSEFNCSVSRDCRCCVYNRVYQLTPSEKACVVDGRHLPVPVTPLCIPKPVNMLIEDVALPSNPCIVEFCAYCKTKNTYLCCGSSDRIVDKFKLFHFLEKNEVLSTQTKLQEIKAYPRRGNVNPVEDADNTFAFCRNAACNAVVVLPYQYFLFEDKKRVVDGKIRCFAHGDPSHAWGKTRQVLYNMFSGLDLTRQNAHVFLSPCSYFACDRKGGCARRQDKRTGAMHCKLVHMPMDGSQPVCVIKAHALSPVACTPSARCHRCDMVRAKLHGFACGVLDVNNSRYMYNCCAVKLAYPSPGVEERTLVHTTSDGKQQSYTLPPSVRMYSCARCEIQQTWYQDVYCAACFFIHSITAHWCYKKPIRL